MDNIIVQNTKQTVKNMSSYISNISIDITILLLLIYYIHNNLDRFSVTKSIFNMEKRYVILTYAILMGVVSILLIYCKSLTVLNNNSLISKVAPVLFILLPYFTAVLIIFMDSNKKIKNDALTQDMDTMPFSYPPKFILPKSLTILIGLIILYFITTNVTIFTGFFSRTDRKTLLNSVLTHHPHRKPSSKIIYFLLSLMAIIHCYILIQNARFTPCNSNLPQSWKV